jgi:Holliday junction resolvase-like predicted endonuclease
MPTLEGAILDKVKQELKAQGWYVIRISQFNKRGYSVHKGISDIIAVGNGRTLFIEVKTAEGKQNDDQLAFEYEVRERGGEYHVVRTVEELTSIIEEG